MKKNTNRNRKNRNNKLKLRFPEIKLPGKTRQWSAGIVVIVAAAVLVLGFFEMAGIVGDGFVWAFRIAIGKAVYALPFVLLLTGLMCFGAKKDNFGGPLVLATLVFTLALAGILAVFDMEAAQAGGGGYLGYYFGLILSNLFGELVAGIFFCALMAIALSIFWWMLGQPLPDISKLWGGKEKKKVVVAPAKPSLAKGVFPPSRPQSAVTMPKFTKVDKKPPVSPKGRKRQSEQEAR